jgi:hypothetical protein
MSSDDWDQYRIFVVGALKRQEEKIDALVDKVQEMQMKVGTASVVASILSSIVFTLLVQFVVKRVM